MTDRHPSRGLAIAAGITALVTMTAGGAKTPDYQSILSSSAATTATSPAPAEKLALDGDQ